ncbi:LOW QUALITY PROTEIN: E3 ubiquitin-protein ligase PRT1-like [Impatiens glandulifera]|uniref:LOW QUALITY PROTEIN: E3 ubiquitin-protein ligase PRT1-like n=1 Tax=Impatiens glandulifera TaxID=253017 RepID=UPI001FB08D1B|nr:LOW QUALITY PROTEIN: E3 ubiquitin-protein ligase PRT1-like [Impatiens glandulifera]
METLSTGEANLEQISEEFYCCICLDLLFKPVVLACGHMSCFWCVHQSMNGLQESQCPICKNQYHYFPAICEVLHFLLVKAYPETYKRRESQILVEEEVKGCSYPSFYPGQHASLIGENLNDKVDNKNTLLNRTFGIVRGGINAVDMKQSNLSETNQKITVNDVLCAACNQLLFHPAVLNCGHVFCTNCIAPSNETVGAVCHVCQRIDPRGFPKVCLAFDNFLVEHFPKEYETRKHAVLLKQAQMQHENPVTCSTTPVENGVQLSSPKEENLQPCWGDKGAHLHTGVGCDICGMFPIVGDRYRCMDCKKEIGFDLCGQCFNSHSKVPGHFNQQHTPEHKFEL